MPTITRHRPKSSPVGDYQAMCSYCGVTYLRSELWKDESGKLVCRDEGNGRSDVALSRELAQDAARPKRTHVPQDGFPMDHNDDPDPVVGNPTPVDFDALARLGP